MPARLTHPASSYMLRSLLLVLTSTIPALVLAQSDPSNNNPTDRLIFAEHFLPKTMRVDYFHIGNATEQKVALDDVVADGLWAGNRCQLVETLELGEYQFEIHDQATQQLLYARGFCSVFGEWQTTAEAKQRWGTFHESLRFPWPLRPVQIILKQRITGQWREIWSETVDPNSRFVTDAETPRRDNVWDIFTNGDPAEKLDIVLLGDGFTQHDMKSFHTAARSLTEALFSVEPFKSRRQDFNVRAIDVVATESGVSRPRDKVFRRSPLSCKYNTFDLPRYALTFNNKAVRDVAAQAPYDCLVILMNENRYGGGGIYNDQTIVAASHGLSSYVMIHEFGHHLAGLADEYYSSNVAYETGQTIELEPWEPNVTALLHDSPLKWQDLVAAKVPIPTPWNKEAFESRGKQTPASQPDGQATQEADDPAKKQTTGQSKSILELLAENTYYGQVGAFEGARYEAKGLYRPTVNCVMFSRSTVEFCPVCRRAIERVIDLHTGQ